MTISEEKIEPQTWSQMQERGTYLGLRTLLFVYTFFGARALGALLYCVIGFYFLVGRVPRRASLSFLRRVHDFMGDKSPWKTRPHLGHSFQHFMSFGQAVTDKIIVWLGHYQKSELDIEGYDAFYAMKQKGRGAVLISSHLGNVEVCRAIASYFKGLPLTVLVHNANAPQFQRILGKVSGHASSVEMIEVQGITPDIAMRLQKKIEAGESIVISGDRTPVDSQMRHEIVPFLGRDASFAQGPFILASLLDCPVFLLFNMKKDGGYKVFFEHFADSLKVPREWREQYIRQCVKNYATRLEHYACAYPLQWFNFYDYWALPQEKNSADSPKIETRP